MLGLWFKNCQLPLFVGAPWCCSSPPVELSVGCQFSSVRFSSLSVWFGFLVPFPFPEQSLDQLSFCCDRVRLAGFSGFSCLCLFVFVVIIVIVCPVVAASTAAVVVAAFPRVFPPKKFNISLQKKKKKTPKPQCVCFFFICFSKLSPSF